MYIQIYYVYLSIGIFVCVWGVGSLLIVYTEIPRVFWALGILFICVGYLWDWYIILGYLVSVGYGVTYYTGLGDHLGIECSFHLSWCGMYIRSFMIVILWLSFSVGAGY